MSSFVEHAKPGPRVSIGIPVYNGANYLRAALKCLLAQTYRDFEIIISDNASTDETAEICQEFAAQDERIRYYRVEANQGLTWNFNRVFELATGEFFTWAAHDDLRSLEYLERCVETLDSQPEVIVCHSQSTCIDAAGNLVQTDCQPEFTSSVTHELTPLAMARRTSRLVSEKPHRRLAGAILYTTLCSEVYGLIRTSALQKTGLLRHFFGSDMVLLAELSLLGKIRVLPETMFFSRSHAAQATFYQGQPEILAETGSTESTAQPAKKPRQKLSCPRKIRYPISLFTLLVAARLPLVERFRCYYVLLQFGSQPKKWRGLWKDVRQLFQRPIFLLRSINSRKLPAQTN